MTHSFESRSLVALIALLALVAGCIAEPDLVQWTPVDAPELRARLDDPTAFVDEQAVREVERQVIEDRLPLIHMLDLLDFGFDRATNRATNGEDPLANAPDLGKVQLFALVGCPGMGDEPHPDFEYGTVRIETASVQDADREGMLGHGDALALFDACIMDGVEMTGPAPLFRETFHGVAVDPDVLVDPPNGAEEFAFDTPFVGTATEADALYELFDGTTLRVTVPRAADVWVMRGRNGSFSCVQSAPGRLSCTQG